MTDKKPQSDKFKEAARKLECDDDDQRFKERLGKLAKPRPKSKITDPVNNAFPTSSRSV